MPKQADMTNNASGLSLLKKGRRGAADLLFSRMGLVLLLLLLQIILNGTHQMLRHAQQIQLTKYTAFCSII